MKTANIDFNPGPEAQGELRRLLIILLKLAYDDMPSPWTDSSP